MKRHQVLLLVILTAIQFTHIMDFVIMMPLGPQLMRHFSIGPQQFGWLVSVYTFAASISGLIASFYVDRFDRKRSLLFLYAGFSVGTLLCALAPNYVLLMLARIAAGAFGGVLSGITFSILGDSFEESVRGTATGAIMSAFSISSIIGIPTGLWLANIYSWHAPFFLLSGTSAAFLLIASFALPSIRGHLTATDHQSQKSFARFKTIVSHPNHVRAFVVTVIMMFSGFSVIPFISPSLVANSGVREVDLAKIYFCSGILTLLMSGFIGRMSDRHGKFKMFRIIALCSIIPIVAITNLPRVPLAVATLVTAAFTISMSGRFIPLMALITSSVERRFRGSFMSIHSCVQQFGSGLASFTAGCIVGRSETSEITRYPYVGAVAVIATLTCVYLAKKIEIVAEKKEPTPDAPVGTAVATVFSDRAT